jgi:hypothetical protein
VQAEQYLPVDANLYSFANLTAVNQVIRHQDFYGYVAFINAASSSSGIADSSFHVRAGNGSASCYSFKRRIIQATFCGPITSV